MKRKYPSTPYLSVSGSTDDKDRVIEAETLYGRNVIITEKMDGENTTIYPDGSMHARSIDSRFHESRSMAKAWASRRLVPQGIRLIVENCYAEHSIRYEGLPEFGFIISAMAGDTHLAWREVERISALTGLPTVPVLYRGVLDVTVLRTVIESIDIDKQEGFVVRPEGPFTGMDSVGKWVRPDHVQTDDHWTNNWRRNGIAGRNLT